MQYTNTSTSFCNKTRHCHYRLACHNTVNIQNNIFFKTTMFRKWWQPSNYWRWRKRKENNLNKKTQQVYRVFFVKVCLLNLNGRIVIQWEKFMMTNIIFFACLCQHCQLLSWQTKWHQKILQFDNQKAILDSWKRQENYLFSCR